MLFTYISRVLQVGHAAHRLYQRAGHLRVRFISVGSGIIHRLTNPFCNTSLLVSLKPEDGIRTSFEDRRTLMWVWRSPSRVRWDGEPFRQLPDSWILINDHNRAEGDWPDSHVFVDCLPHNWSSLRPFHQHRSHHYTHRHAVPFTCPWMSFQGRHREARSTGVWPNQENDARGKELKG